MGAHFMYEVELCMSKVIISLPLILFVLFVVCVFSSFAMIIGVSRGWCKRGCTTWCSRTRNL